MTAPLGFQIGQQGNPIRLRRQIAYQAAEDIPVADSIQATGTLTFSGVTVDAELVVIGADTYEFDSTGGVAGGHIAVDISGGASLAQSATALIAAILAHGTADVTAASGGAGVVKVTAKTGGVADNAIATTTTCLHATWGAATLTGGVDALGGVGAGYVDFRTYGGSVAANPTHYKPQILSGSAEPLAPMLGKVDIGNGPLLIGDLDPANPASLRLLAALFGAYTRTSLPTSGFRYVFRTDGATQLGSVFLSMKEDDDIGRRHRVSNIQPTGLAIGVTPNNPITCAFPTVAGLFDFFGDVTQTVHSGSTLPTPVGFVDSAYLPESEDHDLYLLIVDATAKTCKAKLTALASYGSVLTTYTTDGKKTRLFDETGKPWGSFAEQGGVIFPIGATLTNGDEFKIPRVMGAFPPANFGIRRSIPSPSTRVIIAGNEKRISGGWQFGVNWTNPGVQRIDDTAGFVSAQIVRYGELQGIVTPTREITDLDLQAAIIRRSSIAFAFEAQSYNEFIGSTNNPYRVVGLLPYCLLSGPAFGPAAGGRDRKEAPAFTAGLPPSPFTYSMPNGDVTVSTSVAIVVDTDVDIS